MTARILVCDLKNISKDDTEYVGGKGANLGEMISLGLPVPSGFAVTSYAYDLMLDQSDLARFIYPTLKSINYENQKELESASSAIRKKIKGSDFPYELKKEIITHYKKMSGYFGNQLVAVRSSATAEDMPGTSFAGQQITFLNIKGEANVIDAIKDCWSSLFTPRSIYYRNINKIEHEKVKVAVVVQKMIQSEVSGVMFSIDPVTNEKDRIVIEAVWGLGETIVQGEAIPDKYVVQKDTFFVLSKEINSQDIELKMVKGKNIRSKVKKSLVDKQKISDEEIITLAKYAQKLQKHYYFPQDMEWAKEKGKLFIVQTRPVTTVSKKTINISKGIKEGEIKEESQTPILVGIPASPGMGTGEVQIIVKPSEISRIKTGDVLVSEMTSPDFVPAMKKSSAIITNKGGQTSHAAIVSRELGIPCVVGTKIATKILKNGEVVSVNGVTGEIFKGSNKVLSFKEVKEEVNYSKTATKLYVNIAEPDKAESIAKLPVDGVGLLRAEFMIADIGIHPKEAIKNKKQEIFIKKLENGIERICKPFFPRPVVYRATDFKTNEYRSLSGGKYWEPEESNPMLGFRGAFRYISSPEVFTLELEAIKNVRKKYSNLHLMVPFVRSPQELSKVKRQVIASGLFNDATFKFWMMVELPVNVILLEDFIKEGIDGVSIGSNDLTMLILGTDRDNSEVASCFDERSDAVKWAIKRIIKICNKHNVTSSICGQAPSTYEDYTEFLVNQGITSISVNPDAIPRTKNSIITAENNLLK